METIFNRRQVLRAASGGAAVAALLTASACGGGDAPAAPEVVTGMLDVPAVRLYYEVRGV